MGSEADNGKIAKLIDFGFKCLVSEKRPFPCGGSKDKNVEKWPPTVLKLPFGNKPLRTKNPSEAPPRAGLIFLETYVC